MFIFSQLNFPYSKLRVTATDCGFCAAARPALLWSAGKPRGRAPAVELPPGPCPAPGRSLPRSRPFRYPLALVYAYPPALSRSGPCKARQSLPPLTGAPQPGAAPLPAREGPGL